jgi:serine protease Do
MRKVFLYRFASAFALALFAMSVHAQLPDFTQLVEKNAPAVVNVQASSGEGKSQTADADADDNDNGIDDQDVPDILRRFFGPNGPNGGGGGGAHPRAGARVSLGSGFIISDDGYVLTNNHVIDSADKITVVLSDRRELDAKVIGTDADSDIALLKINAANLPTVVLGDSDKLKPGQWVVAIGSPFNFDHSVTHGVVSYVGRSSPNRNEQYVPFIQTDVPINRGNSGGPLFNLDGKVVGINSQIFSNTGSSVGISFSIPINIAMNTVDQLKSSGHVSRGLLGVGIQGVARETAQSLGLPRPGGALVNNVSVGSGAEKAGVQVGDVILAYNGHQIDQASELPLQVGNTKPGTQADLQIYRDGKTINVPVTVGELPRDKAQVASLQRGEGATSRNALGLVVEDITAEQRKQLGMKEPNGVVISDVKGPARRSPVQAGDVVLMVGRKAVKSTADFNAAVKDVKPGDSTMLLVKRGDATQFVTISVPEVKKG